MYLTLEESTTEQVSPLLEDILKNIQLEKNLTDTIQKDYLFILIMVSLMENGFVPINSDLEIIKSITHEQLCLWKSNIGLYETSIIMLGFKSVPLKLIISPLGATALVNLVIKDLNSETYSVCLPISRYVVSPNASTIPMIFRDLKHFSTTFKNKILSPVKSRILSYCGYASASLIGLPEELLFNILLSLSVTDVVNVCKTCTRLKFLIENNNLWHDMYKRDFNNDDEANRNDWKTLYKEKFILQCDRELRNRGGVAGNMHDYMDYADYVSYIDNPMWDVLI